MTANAREVPAPMLPSDGFVRLRQVLQFVPVSASSWWRGVRSGRYPAATKLGPRTTAWNVRDIRELLARMEASK